MEVAGVLAKEGFFVTLVEKDKQTGGHIQNWHHLFPDRRDGREVSQYLKKQIDNKNISLLSNSLVNEIEKRHGTFIVKTAEGNELKADAVVITTGFDLFRCEKKEEYGYGIYDNVITSADLEKMFNDRKIATTQGQVPKKIGIVHCVGSRDEKSGNIYCSKLCCVTAVKQAMEIRELIPESKVFCFYMDIRMGGAMYEELYKEAQEKYGINFIRGKVSEASETIDGKLVVKVEDTLVGRPLRMELDMLVLMAGMEMSESSAIIARSSGLNTGDNRFFAAADAHFGSNLSNISGIFYAGACTAPLNITETISHARSAAFEVIEYLKDDKR